MLVLKEQAGIPYGTVKYVRQAVKGGGAMKLVIAVVEDDDTPALVEELTENKFQATKLASTG